MEYALEMLKVAKSLGQRPIVEDFTLRLAGGQVWCLWGPSGVGKSTILEMAAGLLPPDQGVIRAQRQSLGYAFQDDALVPWLGAQANLELVLGARLGRQDAADRARYWLDQLGILSAAKLKPSQMSGGMRRRLNIARAFSLRPRLLLLDEPFAFLDQAWQQTMALFIARAAQEDQAAVLLVSHQAEPLSHLDCTISRLGSEKEPGLPVCATR